MIALGGANPGRYIDELVEAIEHFKNIKLVIVGPYESNVIKNLQKRWGKKLDDFCYFTGYIPQCFMVNYIDDAMASIVLYNYDTDNNKYCAPNRLYQSAARGIPLIVGANPTMANFLNNYKCGVILHDDGRDVNSIRIGVKKMLDNFSMYKNHAVTIRDKNIVTWESQIMVFKKLLNL
jgi:glycosyltransferase involved in cell wall biosynthesis